MSSPPIHGNRARPPAYLLLALAALAHGCATLERYARAQIIEQVAFDHNCPPRQVTILQEFPSIGGYRLDVCGRVRNYRQVDRDSAIIVDVTEGRPMYFQAIPPPR